MRIEFVEISNFRKLLAVHVDFTDTTTLLVGANNSGKTSAMLALRHFLVDGGRFSTNDFTLSHWGAINAIGEQWIALAAGGSGEMPSLDDWISILPALDVWLNIQPDEIHYVRTIIPTLSWTSGSIGVRLRYEPKDIVALYADFLEAYSAAHKTKAAAAAQTGGKEFAVNLWPSTMVDFLERKIRQHFTIRGYVLDPTKCVPPEKGVAKPQALPMGALPIDGNPLAGLIRIHEIDAQRGFGQSSDKVDSTRDGGSGSPQRRESRRLSDQLRSYYEKHLDPFDQPNPSDLEALEAIENAQKAFDARLGDCFADALKEVAGLGYPGVSDPRLRIATRIRPTDGMNHEAAVQYEVDMKPGAAPGLALRLPEDSNGLGYQNLVSMIFQLMSFRDAWMRVGKAGKGKQPEDSDFDLEPLHLVLIEEPEAHLHAQVQQVFIRKAFEILRAHADLGSSTRLTTQLVVSTHSSHVAHETKFGNLRYFRRLPASQSGSVPVSTVVNLSEVFGAGDDTNEFATRYLRAAHCDLFFADAAILVEGPAERMLVPHFIRNHFPELNQCYVTLLEIGGSHAHRLEPLLKHLGLPTLVITDIDSTNDTGSPQPTERGAGQVTGNATLKTWVPKRATVDDLIDMKAAGKILAFDDASAVRAAFQTPIPFKEEGKADTEACPYTFEDALVFSNIPIFESLSGTGLVKKFKTAIEANKDAKSLGKALFDSLKNAKKAEFALDILALKDPAALKVPAYISEGLDWLQTQLQKRQLEVLEMGNPESGAAA